MKPFLKFQPTPVYRVVYFSRAGRKGTIKLVEDEYQPNWLYVALGRDGAPTAPALNSERIKAFLSRALLTPGDLTATEVQELAASVLAHLAANHP